VRVVVGGEHEHRIDPAIGRTGDDRVDESTADATPLVGDSDREVMDEELRSSATRPAT